MVVILAHLLTSLTKQGYYVETHKGRIRMKRIPVAIIAGLFLLTLILPQLALAAGPAISNVSVTAITGTTATITWFTNTTSDSRVNYGTTTALGDYVSDNSTVNNHLILLQGLNPGTIYYFEVESTDGSGTSTDNNGGACYSFTTTPPTTYSITLNPACGLCGDLWKPQVCNEVIGVTASVATAGDYRICWDSRAAANVVEGGTFTATGAGTYTLTFRMPEATRGIHKVYLTNNFYDDLGPDAVAEFEVRPSVKITPEEGPVGTQVILNGYGFSASQAIGVTLFQGEVKKGDEKTTTANSVGSWTMNYTIPQTPAGGYTFNVGPPNSNEVWVIKYFKVIPQITVTPDWGTVGQTINVDGTGFASEEEDIKVTFDGEVRRQDFLVYADGSWHTSISVPMRTCGRYIIDASGRTTRARDVEDVMFTLVAGISVEPASAYVGETITVAGGGFAPGEKGIRVTFDEAVVATDIPVDIYGCWNSSFVLPASTCGSHTVSASGDTTAAVTTTLNTKAKITGVSPVEGAPGDYVSLSGSGFHGSQGLTVRIGNIPASGSMQTQANGNFDITFRVPKGSTEGQQTLEVTDGEVTDSTYFTVTKKTLSTIPLPISPKDSTLRSGKVTFKWQGSTGSTGYTYTLEVSETADFITTIFPPKSDIEASSYTLTDTETVAETLQKGTYYWRVKIVDDYGNEGPWSDSIQFTVAPIPTWVWVVVGVVVLIVLMVVAYRETKFKVTE